MIPLLRMWSRIHSPKWQEPECEGAVGDEPGKDGFAFWRLWSPLTCSLQLPLFFGTTLINIRLAESC